FCRSAFSSPRSSIIKDAGPITPVMEISGVHKSFCVSLACGAGDTFGFSLSAWALAANTNRMDKIKFGIKFILDLHEVLNDFLNLTPDFLFMRLNFGSRTLKHRCQTGSVS